MQVKHLDAFSLEKLLISNTNILQNFIDIQTTLFPWINEYAAHLLVILWKWWSWLPEVDLNHWDSLGTSKLPCIQLMLERLQTFGRLRSIYPKMINHFASQSQSCQLLTIILLKHCKEIVKTGAISGWTDEDQLQIRSSQAAGQKAAQCQIPFHTRKISYKSI